MAVARFTRHPLPAVRLAATSALAHQSCASTLAFTLLGGFSVTRDRWRVEDVAWERRVAQRLVRFLLSQRDRPVTEDKLREVFWPDRRLAAQLRSLVAGFDPGNATQRAVVCRALSDFISAVRLLSGHGIPPATAAIWIGDAERIRAVLACRDATR